MLNRLMTFFMLSLWLASVANAASSTARIPQFANDKVTVWKTIIYPGMKQTLKMHRHEHDRVVIALSNGLLKITNDKGKIHYLKLSKNKAYFLAKDVGGELHKDESMTAHTIEVIVIELKN